MNVSKQLFVYISEHAGKGIDKSRADMYLKYVMKCSMEEQGTSCFTLDVACVCEVFARAGAIYPVGSKNKDWSWT